MKKTTKILAVILAMITLMSSFSIMSGAINSKSSAKELLDYYEDCIIKTSAKEDVVMAKNVYKYKATADYSSLKGKDLEETKKDNEEWEYCTGKWETSKYNLYYFCDSHGLDYDGRSEFVDAFSIKRDIRAYELKFKSAKYSKADNGDVTLKFVYTYTDDYMSGKATMTYTVKINKNGYLKSHAINDVYSYEEYSIEENPYKVKAERVDESTFTYSKVDAKSIELSENEVNLGKDGECTVTATVKPGNATFKDVYCVSDNWEVADAYVDENGEINIYAMGPGETTVDVFAYSGDVVETINVEVKYTFFENIAYFFESLTWKIQDFFWNLFYGYEEDYEEVYDDGEFVCGGVVVEE